MANAVIHTINHGYRAPLGANALAKRQGWNDAVAGAPPDPAYMDHADREIAWNYEAGRLFALNVRAAGMVPKRWVTTNSTPTALGAQLNRANRLIGRATPSHSKR